MHDLLTYIVGTSNSQSLSTVLQQTCYPLSSSPRLPWRRWVVRYPKHRRLEMWWTQASYPKLSLYYRGRPRISGSSNTTRRRSTPKTTGRRAGTRTCHPVGRLSLRAGLVGCRNASTVTTWTAGTVPLAEGRVGSRDRTDLTKILCTATMRVPHAWNGLSLRSRVVGSVGRCMEALHRITTWMDRRSMQWIYRRLVIWDISKYSLRS